MSYYDVFNGDADGLCALHQLRLAEPRPAELVTGPKRDNALLARVPAVAGDSVTVLDISMATNRLALETLLERGVRVSYFDHHWVDDPPIHPHLEAVIDTAPDVCTSVLVDRCLGGRHRAWAVVGAFGDAMPATAGTLAASLGLGSPTLDRLRRLGECLNYNSCGESAADLLYQPEALYRLMQPHADPRRFLDSEPACQRLDRQYGEDLEKTLAVPPLAREDGAAVHLLPDAPWSRRIAASFANRLALAAPDQAHAVLAPDGRGRLTVSLRVPAGAAVSANRFASRYGGSGRVTAAGIDRLPAGAARELARQFLGTYRAVPDQAAAAR